MAQMKRKPSATQVAKDERRKMVTFLNSALNVNVKMLIKMTYQNLEDLYTQEMKTLQGDTETFSRRVNDREKAESKA